MINSDDIHFVAFKKKQQLRIKGQIGSFICNSRATGEESNKMLKEMNFSLSFPWHYDPCGIIAKTVLKNNISPYAHVPKPEIERFMNQTEWEENTLLDTEQQPSPASHFTNQYSTGTNREEIQERSISLSHRSLNKRLPSLYEEAQD
jgi:hypothetical protein